MTYKKTDLKFLFKTYPVGWLRWTDEKIHDLVNTIKAGESDMAKLAKKFDVKESSVKNIICELKRAANNGMSLEQYLKKGRPLRTGKKVLA